MSRHNSMVLWKAIALTGLCAAALWGLWWWGLVHSPRAQIRARAQDSLVQMERILAREQRRAESTGLAFGAWWSREHGRLDDPVKLQNVIGFLERGEIITNLLLSRQDGDSACIVRLDGAWNLVLFRSGRHPRRYRVEKGRWVPVPTDDGEVYDARSRHWYKFGAAQRAPAWTPEAYRFQSSLVGGFTFTIPIRGAQGVLEGVIGVDVSLEELTQLIWEHQPTPGTRMMVTDARGLLLVPPRTTEMREARARFGAQLAPVPDSFQSEPGQGRVARFLGALGLMDTGRSFISAHGSYEPGGTPPMSLHVSIPEGDLFPGLGRRRLITFLLALAAVLGAAWSLLDLHRRIVRPIRELAHEAEAHESGLAEREEFDSDVWEIQRVGQRLIVAGKAAQERKLLLTQVEHSQRVDSVGMMAPGIVHDVNNHLTLILAQISFCQGLYEDHPHLQPRLQAAEDAARKCSEVLRSLLVYSKPDQGQRELTSLNSLVEAGAALLRRVLGPSIRIKEDLDPDLPVLFGVPVQLQQVLINLGLNARDAMPDGGTLTIRTFKDGGKVSLEVADTGCGMDDEVKGRIFDPFFTTKDPGRGTGLGLAMVANIVKDHGARIQVESGPGGGTRFRLDFPPSLRRREEPEGSRLDLGSMAMESGQ